MKKLLSLLGIVAFIFLLTGCEEVKLGDKFLSKPAGGDVTIDTVYANLDNAKGALTAAYNTLHYGISVNWPQGHDGMNMDMLASLTDLTQSYLQWGGVNRLYYSGAYNAGIENAYSADGKYHWYGEQNWLGIRRAWSFIAHIDEVPDASQETKDRLKGEAMMVIACHYSDMFRNYGGLPWINKAYAPDADFKAPRMTAEATMDSIVGLIDRASKKLPWTVQDYNNDQGRFTRAAAEALKVRVLLFGASPLFNNNEPFRAGEASDKKMTWFGGYDPSHWQDVIDACQTFINDLNSHGFYSLVSTGNPRKDFKSAYYDRGNHEILISTRYRYKSGGAGYYLYNGMKGGIARPSQELVDKYPMKNGLNIDAAGSGFDPNDPYANRDPRLYETVIVNGDKYRGRTAELYLGGRDRRNKNVRMAGTGYMARKFYLDGDNATSVGSVVQWPYLRLPEVYLSYAEALNEANGGPTAKAYEYLNKTRERVDVGDVPTGLSQKAFRKAVLNERAREFAYEEVRWYDLIRWKMPFIQPHGMNIYVDNPNAANPKVTKREEFVTSPKRAWLKNFDPKWYLSAFPPNDVNKGYGLIQNPGW